jgi:hypothetical protein
MIDITYDTDAKVKELSLDRPPILYSTTSSEHIDNWYTKDELDALCYIYSHKEVPEDLKQRILSNPTKVENLETYDITNDSILINLLNKHWK